MTYNEIYREYAEYTSTSATTTWRQAAIALRNTLDYNKITSEAYLELYNPNGNINAYPLLAKANSRVYFSIAETGTNTLVITTIVITTDSGAGFLRAYGNAQGNSFSDLSNNAFGNSNRLRIYY